MAAAEAVEDAAGRFPRTPGLNACLIELLARARGRNATGGEGGRAGRGEGLREGEGEGDSSVITSCTYHLAPISNNGQFGRS